MLHTAFVLALMACSQAWVMEANVDEIVPGRTENVEIQCKHKIGADDSLEKGHISRIRIVKVDPFGHKTGLAEFRIAANETSKDEDKILVTCGMDEKTVFLKVTWPLATESTAGAYSCEIHGFDERDEFINRQLAPLMIKEKVLTVDDVKELIRSVTLDLYQKQEKLEMSLAKLRAIANEEMQAIRREVEDHDAKQEQEIDKLKELVDSTCATKRELSERLSELEEFTTTELRSLKNSRKGKQEEFLSTIRNASMACEVKVSETSSELAVIRNVFTDKLESLNQKSKETVEQLGSTFTELKGKIHLIDIKYGRSINNVSESFEKKLSEIICSCNTPEESTIPSITTPSNVVDESKTGKRESIQWPDGDFGLVQPPSGCPDPKQLTVNGRRLFTSEAYYENTSLFKSKQKDQLKEKFKVYVSSGATKSELSFCYKKGPRGNLPWPKGTYCIARQDSCPEFFESGQTWYFSQYLKKTYLGFFEVKYCCRSDGQASSPINLPTEKPFYLYRYRGACQQVKGMNVTNHLIQIELAKYVRISKVRQIDFHPDTNSAGNPVSLCYYHSSITDANLKNKLKDYQKTNNSRKVVNNREGSDEESESHEEKHWNNYWSKKRKDDNRSDGSHEKTHRYSNWLKKHKDDDSGSGGSHEEKHDHRHSSKSQEADDSGSGQSGDNGSD